MDSDTVQKESSPSKERQQKYFKKSIQINTRTAIIIAIVIIIGVLAYIYKGVFIAATVDGSPIMRLTIIQKLEKTSGKNLLDSLINEKLIQNEVRAKNIIVSDDEINSQTKTIESQIATQGGTLDAALAEAGMSMDDLKKQIMAQKEIEKLLADKINVTDEEVAQYIKDNKVSIPQGQEATMADQIKSEMRNQKISTEAQTLITNLKSKAKIQRFVNY
ncbi:MAG: hypothetical protein A3C12_01830 [Candidatus Sungbacteria bacterium RIFCSPHIGHO2_02_FULL_49_20]|uniref:SurA N-terminal domain-containing protein n=1 Tax=Candidatus Sungbacteria bacterium RIFCSPHIGHO2_02_FULL_49_20 TaxID=1802272 RepID=A0A1G2KSK9_9BACT|nr:MAG: hypothetical protein A3C12_01830 [Candidatus Sungbacteria bacterium RIFCSPHIGHO2_02_FULL_49_20]